MINLFKYVKYYCTVLIFICRFFIYRYNDIFSSIITIFNSINSCLPYFFEMYLYLFTQNYMPFYRGGANKFSVSPLSLDSVPECPQQYILETTKAFRPEYYPVRYTIPKYPG